MSQQKPRAVLIKSRLSKVDGPVIRKAARFGFAGIAATLVYFILFLIIQAVTHWDRTIVSVVAYLFALAFSYFAQSRFTFRVERDTEAQVARFIILSLLGLVVSTATVEASKVFEISAWVAAGIVCVLIPVVNFIAMNFWVFHSKSHQKS